MGSQGCVDSREALGPVIGGRKREISQNCWSAAATNAYDSDEATSLCLFLHPHFPWGVHWWRGPLHACLWYSGSSFSHYIWKYIHTNLQNIVWAFREIPPVCLFVCLSLFHHFFCLSVSFFQLLTHVPPVMVKALAPTSVSSTSTRPSPVPALTSWSCSLTNAHAKVRTDAVTNTYRPVCSHNTVICNPCHQGARNRLFVCKKQSRPLRCAQLPYVISTSLAVISYDRIPNCFFSFCATWPSSLSFPFHFI